MKEQKTRTERIIGAVPAPLNLHAVFADPDHEGITTSPVLCLQLTRRVSRVSGIETEVSMFSPVVLEGGEAVEVDSSEFPDFLGITMDCHPWWTDWKPQLRIVLGELKYREMVARLEATVNTDD